MVRHFEASFVNCFVDAKHHVSFDKEKKEYEPVKINDEKIEKYLKLITIPEGLEIQNTSKLNCIFVNLKNVNGYECPTCSRTHEKENPFLLITNQGVFFQCRRSENKKTTCLLKIQKKDDNILLDDIIIKLTSDKYNSVEEVLFDLKQVIAFSTSNGEGYVALKVKTIGGYSFKIKSFDGFFKLIKGCKFNKLKVIDGKEEFISYKLVNIIVSNRGQFTYRDGIKLLPLRPDQNPQDNETVFNLFRGWQAKLVDKYDEIKIQPIINHFMEVYSNHNEKHFNYIISYLARMVQYPNRKSQTAICLVGPEGAGKNIIFNWIIKYIVGTKFSFITDRMDYLTGRFNSSIINKLLIICDESSDKNNYHVDMNRLKALITNETIAVELKGFEVEEYENMSSIFMFSNDLNCFQLSYENRRIAAFLLSNKYCRDKNYFDQLETHLNQETANHFLTYLFQYDISNWNHNDIPDTEALQEMMMNNEIDFLLNHFDETLYDHENRVSIDTFYKQYVDYCFSNGITKIGKHKIIKSLGNKLIEKCKWDSGRIIGFKKKFNKTEE
jgi:hypothetical protein